MHEISRSQAISLMALANPASESLESLLNQVLQFGRIYIHTADDGSHCARLQLFVSVPGMKSEIHSGFDHKTIRSAVHQVSTTVHDLFASSIPNEK